MVLVNAFNYQYSGGKTLSFPAFSVEAGETCLLLGNSGSGKTTLLHLLGGLLRAEAGCIQVNGKDVGAMDEGDRDRFRGENVGFVFQQNHLIDALTVRHNLLLAPFLRRVPGDTTRVDALLHALGLDGMGHRYPHQISQGQAQRVAIARALMNRPALVLADEPTAALDDENCDRVIHLLMELSQQHGTALVVATHDQRLKSLISKQIPITNG